MKKLTYTNERGESVVFSASSVFHTNISKDVTGLSDVNNELFRINSMGQDGDTYLGGRIIARDIEIIGHIKERDKQSVQSIRRRLNYVLNPKHSGVLTYEMDGFKRLINCHIISAPVFAASPLYDSFIIQLCCLNPFWREETETREEVAAWIGTFEWPVEIDDVDCMEFGYREPSLIVNVFNSGDVASGMRIEFKALGTLKNPAILNVNTFEYMRFDIEMIKDDILTVSTGYGEKEITLMRNGVISNAFRYIDSGSTYLQMDVGDNLFRYSADNGEINLEVTIYHNNFYLGV